MWPYFTVTLEGHIRQVRLYTIVNWFWEKTFHITIFNEGQAWDVRFNEKSISSITYQRCQWRQHNVIVEIKNNMFLSLILTFVVFDLTEWYCQNQRNRLLYWRLSVIVRSNTLWRYRLKTIRSVLKISTCIITAHPIGLAAILTIMLSRPSELWLFFMYHACRLIIEIIKWLQLMSFLIGWRP
jgi:hypothetical protein